MTYGAGWVGRESQRVSTLVPKDGWKQQYFGLTTSILASLFFHNIPTPLHPPFVTLFKLALPRTLHAPLFRLYKHNGVRAIHRAHSD